VLLSKLLVNSLHIFLKLILLSLRSSELSKINTELNSKLTAEIEKFKARDAGYASEAQKILNDRINSIEEACCNEFGRISFNFNASIETFQNEMI
jgi:hypothetical protein